MRKVVLMKRRRKKRRRRKITVARCLALAFVAQKKRERKDIQILPVLRKTAKH